MKTILFVLAIIVAIQFASCCPEKDIQVVCHIWTLVDKQPATRLVDNEVTEFKWLVWQDDRGEQFRERVTKEEAAGYVLGMRIHNRDRR